MTLRQKKALKLVEKGRTLGEVMVAAGYSPNTAKAPTKLTKSKGWLKILNEKLPDEELLTVTKEALKADKIYSPPDEPSMIIPDHAIRLKASEQGFRLKGKFPKEGGVNIEEAKILVMPAELITKYDIPSDSSDSSK